MYGAIKVDTIIYGNDKILNISDILTKVDISDIYGRLNEKVDKAYIDGNIEILQTKIDNIIKDVNDKIQELKDTKNKIEILEVEQNNLKINYNSLKQQTDINTNDIQILKNDITQINIFNKDVDSRLDNLEANSQTINIDALKNKVDTIDSKLDNEISRAKSAESDLSLRINTEENRAKSEEKKLNDLIETETKRAIAKENELQSEIDNKAEKNDSRFASAFVLFDGTDGSILKSFNIEKVTRDDKGKYTITFNLDNPIPIISGNSSPDGASDTYTLKIDSLSNTELKIVNIGKTKDSSGNEVTSYEDSKIVSIVIF